MFLGFHWGASDGVPARFPVEFYPTLGPRFKPQEIWGSYPASRRYYVWQMWLFFKHSHYFEGDMCLCDFRNLLSFDVQGCQQAMMLGEYSEIFSKLVILDPKPGFQCVKTAQRRAQNRQDSHAVDQTISHGGPLQLHPQVSYIPLHPHYKSLYIYIYPMKNLCWSTSNIIPICLGQVTIISPWKIPSHCL